MKKNLQSIIIGICCTIFIASPAFAATTISLTPANISLREGQTISLAMEINADGIKNYTVKTELQFPKDLIEIQSFSFGSGWMMLSQPGYDLIDNEKGTLVKTAGYPGGVSAKTLFGTVLFKAKKNGTGAVILSGNSFALDAKNQNILNSAQKIQASITVLGAPSISPAAPVKTTEEKLVIEQAQEEDPPLIGEVSGIATTSSVPNQTAPNPILAQISSIATLGSNKLLVSIAALSIVLIIVGTIIWFRRKKKSQ